MPERVNIASIAEIVSSDIFSKLGWENYGPPNESWACVQPSTHHKKDHPTDVTFVYEDPYSLKNVHMITDLKSYAAGSIHDFPLKETLESLASAVDCAKTNKNWKDLYLKPGKDFDVQGLLFIYNHDSQYDRNFHAQLKKTTPHDLKIPRGVRLSILGPDEIWYLGDILNDIANLARDGVIPYQKERLSFYYYSDSRKRFAPRASSAVATIDVLKGKYQLLTYNHQGKNGQPSIRGLLVYYRGPGIEVKEFILLIDMLRSFGLLDSVDEIHIRCPRSISQASISFEKARSQYAEYPELEMPDKLKKIKFASVPTVRPRLTQYEVAFKGV